MQFVLKKISCPDPSGILTLHQILRHNGKGRDSPLLSLLPLELSWFKPAEEVSAKLRLLSLMKQVTWRSLGGLKNGLTKEYFVFPSWF